MCGHDEAPVGTVVVVGHPANGVLAQKVQLGWPEPHTEWRYLEATGRTLDFDTLHKGSSLLYPEEATTI